MSTIRSLARSFTGGEVTPEFYGRVDDAKFQAGLATCRNFVIYPHGPAANRPGTLFVNPVKDSTKKVRLLPFTYNTTQTFALEMGNEYFRMHTAGATLLAGTVAAYNNGTAYNISDLSSSGGVNYYCIASTTGHAPPNATYWYPMPTDGTFEIPSPFLEADLFDIHFVQSEDVFTLVHPGYAPRELDRLGAVAWTLTPIDFTAQLFPPTISVSSNAKGTDYNYQYVVTTVSADGLTESAPSASPAAVANNLFDTGGINTITWTPAGGGILYNVYKLNGGVYGYIGQTALGTFADDNIAANLAITPPIYDAVLASADNYPGSVSYFQQRRIFAGTINQPQNIWFTAEGTESNMTFQAPLRDSNRIAFRIAALDANTIRHVVPLRALILLTSSAEWQITSINSDAITPTTVSVSPQAHVGSSNVTPQIVNNLLLYVAARGGHLRELSYSWQVGGYTSNDLSLRAPHLFDGFDIADMCYVQAPRPMLWATSSNGSLLGLTYVPEQQITAWHHHDTATGNGANPSAFESVCGVAEGIEDAVYVVVNRLINGATVRYVERFSSRAFATPADAYFVDCGATYSGAPTSTITGLTWLKGETVNILADGAVQAPAIVDSSGSVALTTAASKVQIGLPIVADIQTLPLSFEAQAFGQGLAKNVNKVWVRVNESSGISVGPAFNDLTPATVRNIEPYDTPPALKTGEIMIEIDPAWSTDGSVCLRQTDPLPLTLVSMVMEVSIGA